MGYPEAAKMVNTIKAYCEWSLVPVIATTSLNVNKNMY